MLSTKHKVFFIVLETKSLWELIHFYPLSKSMLGFDDFITKPKMSIRLPSSPHWLLQLVGIYPTAGDYNVASTEPRQMALSARENNRDMALCPILLHKRTSATTRLTSSEL